MKNTDHIRDKGGKIPILIDQVATKFSNPDNARDYLECIRVDKPRYIRDQVILIQKAIKESPQKAIDDALDFCMKNKLYRATDFRDAVIHFKRDRQVTKDNFTVKVSYMSDETLEKIKITPKIRDMSEYINALGGIKNVNHN